MLHVGWLNLQGPAHFGPAEVASHRMRRTAPMYLGKAFGALHRTIEIQHIQKPSGSQARQESISCHFLSLSSGTADCEVDCMASTAEVFQSNEMCCDRTCALVKCQAGFKNKGEKALALTHDECCDTWRTEWGCREPTSQR